MTVNKAGYSRMATRPRRFPLVNPLQIDGCHDQK